MTARLAPLAAILAATMVFATPAPAQQVTTSQLAIMDSIAESPVIERRIAGLTVAVLRGGDTLLMKAYGRADLEWDVPMTLDAVFEIGSITKQFTAAAVLRLRDKGKLDLNADITTYLPDYPTQGHAIPVRRLLDHTSGIKGYTEMRVFREIVRQELPRDSLVTLIAAEPFDFAPGDALIYNNSAYFLLGLIIEKVSGRTYEDYVERELFQPLGMTRSSYCSTDEIVTRRARGYRLRPEGLVPGEFVDHRWPYSAGSLCSTAGDLITWLKALHGGVVLPDSSYRQMITPGTLNDGTPVRYAMGLSVAPDPAGRPVIAHGGGIQTGFVTHSAYYPEHDLYVVMLVNTGGNLSPAALSGEIVDVILPPPPRTAPRQYTGDTAPLVGVYKGPARGREVAVRVRATARGLEAGPADRERSVPLDWVEGWTFNLGPVQVITFRRAGDRGPATELHLDGGGNHLVLKRQRD